MPDSWKVPPEHARRFMRAAQRLDDPFPDLGTALDYLGYVQVDPINVCGRMHDLILRNRVSGYREGALHDFIHHRDRPGFEHYLPHSGILVTFPRDAWPFLAPLLANRQLRRGPAYRRRLGVKHERLARRILDEIAARGPLTSDDIEHEGRSVTGWGSPGRLVKNLLEVMFVHGRVLITARRGFRRVYDLPERVVPPALLRAPPKPERETARWTVLLRLRQRRLARLLPRELKLVADEVQHVDVPGIPALYCLRDDLPLLDAVRADRPSLAPLSAAHPTPLLLAPLDPLIYDRRITSRLWDFDYTWEVYTPPSKRRRGYYALPVLSGLALVGHLDLKADRDAGRLRVVSSAIRRGHRAGDARRQLAQFLALR